MLSGSINYTNSKGRLRVLGGQQAKPPLAYQAMLGEFVVRGKPSGVGGFGGFAFRRLLLRDFTMQQGQRGGREE